MTSEFRVHLLDSSFNALGQIYPVESPNIGPNYIRFARNWREMTQLELEIHRAWAFGQGPDWADALTTPGNYLLIRRTNSYSGVNDEAHAIYRIAKSETHVGAMTYIKDISDTINVFYVGGYLGGETTYTYTRDLFEQRNAPSISTYGRLEGFLDHSEQPSMGGGAARQLQQAVWAENALRGLPLTTQLEGSIGQPVSALQETIRITALDPKFWLARRIVCMPPIGVASNAAGGQAVTAPVLNFHALNDKPRDMLRRMVNVHALGLADGSGAPGAGTTPHYPTVLTARAVAGLSVESAVGTGTSYANYCPMKPLLEGLQDICALSEGVNGEPIGFEIVPTQASPGGAYAMQFQTSAVASGGVFYEDDIDLDRDGHNYAEDWDIGSLVDVDLGPLGVTASAIIREVEVELRPEQPVHYRLAFDKWSVNAAIAAAAKLRTAGWLGVGASRR